MKTATTILFAAFLAASAGAFSGNKPEITTSKPKQEISRSKFIAGVSGAFLAANVMKPAFAKTLEDANLKGAKSKVNEKVCMDRCLYECTSKGKSKEECTEGCKTVCSTAKGQLTYATPGGKKGSE